MIYIYMIFIYGLSCVLFIWYFWVTCPSDFFLGSEGPKAAASAGSLVTLRDASLSPPTDVYNWKGSTHMHTQSCWRFKSQGIQHSTNIGLAWCSAKISIDSAMLQQSLSLSQHQRQILQQQKTCWSQVHFLITQSLLLDYWPILLRVSIQHENGSKAWPKKILLFFKSKTCLHWRSHLDPEHQKRLQMSRDRLPTT